MHHTTLDFARRGMDAVRERTLQLRDQAAHAPAVTVNYVKHEPVKSALIASAAAASLLAVGWALWRQRGMH